MIKKLFFILLFFNSFFINFSKSTSQQRLLKELSMVEIKGGYFFFGGYKTKNSELKYVPGFYICNHKVTNREYRELLEWCKKNKKMDHIDEEYISMIPSKEEVEYDVISNSNKLELYKRLQKLDKQTREVIYLRITGELSFKEIADILNKTENWARVTFYRGKLKLKEGDDNDR